MERKQILEKARIQKELEEKMTGAQSVVFVDFRGVSVADDTRLRRMCREQDVEYRVVKNSLTARALDNLGWDGLEEVLQGPTAMALSMVDPVAPAKVMAGFAREVPNLKVKGGIMDGKALPVERVLFLGSLPGKEEILAQVAWALKSPMSSMATVLDGMLSGFARAVNALREKRESEAS